MILAFLATVGVVYFSGAKAAKRKAKDAAERTTQKLVAKLDRQAASEAKARTRHIDTLAETIAMPDADIAKAASNLFAGPTSLDGPTLDRIAKAYALSAEDRDSLGIGEEKKR